MILVIAGPEMFARLTAQVSSCKEKLLIMFMMIFFMFLNFLSLPEAFTDDNIQDDIKCFMDGKYLG